VYSDGVLLITVVCLHRVTIKNFNLHSYSVVLLYIRCAPWRGPWVGGELLHWEPWKICSDSLRIWASLSIGVPMAPRGTWCLGGGGGPYTGDFERWMKDGSLLGNSKVC